MLSPSADPLVLSPGNACLSSEAAADEEVGEDTDSLLKDEPCGCSSPPPLNPLLILLAASFPRVGELWYFVGENDAGDGDALLRL